MIAQVILNNFEVILQTFGLILTSVIAALATVYATYQKKQAKKSKLQLNNELKLKIQMITELELRGAVEREHMNIHRLHGEGVTYKVHARNLAEMEVGAVFNPKFTPKNLATRKQRYQDRLRELELE